MRMRTDVTIDRKQVRCPNTSHGGYDKYKAQVGDIVLFNESGHSLVGRMIGRIVYAPPCGETPAIRNYILVIALSQDMTFSMERWVNPADVMRVQAPRSHKQVMDYFLSDQIVKAPVSEVRAAASEMWTTLDQYLEWKIKTGVTA